MLDGIRQSCVDYYDALPGNIPQAIGWSATISFVASVLFAKRVDGTFDLTRPLMSAAIAATASAVHALVTPLFKAIGVDGTNIWEELAKWTFTIVITSGLFNLALAPEADLKQFVLYSPVAVNWLRRLWWSDPDRGPLTNNSEYIYCGF